MEAIKKILRLENMLSISLLLQRRSQNIKEVPQNFTEVFNIGDVIQRNQHRKEKNNKLEFHSNS